MMLGLGLYFEEKLSFYKRNQEVAAITSGDFLFHFLREFRRYWEIYWPGTIWWYPVIACKTY